MLKNLLEPPLLTQLLNYSPISLAFFLSFFLNNVLQLNPKPDKQAYGACAQAKVPSERAIHMCMVNEMYNILSGKTTTKKYMITCISRKKIPPSWTAASGTTPWLRDRFHDSPFLNPLSIWAVLGKLHHHLPPVHQPPVQAINCLLGLVLILVPHEGKPSRVASPAVPGDVDVDDLAVLVEEREKVIGRRTEGDVEDEEGVGVADRRRAGAPEARHLAGAGAGGGAGGGAAVGERRGERIGGNDKRRDVGAPRPTPAALDR